MSVNCEHFRPIGPAHGACAIGLFGGRPSHGTCRRCENRKPRSHYVPIALPPRQIDHPLRELNDRVASYGGDAEKELSFIADLPSRANVGAADARRWIDAYPPTLTDRVRYQDWAWKFQNHIAIRRGRAPITFSEAVERNNWNRFIVPDRIVCLSLDSRPDRWAAFTASCQKSRYLSRWKIERYRARPPSEMIVPDWWRFGFAGADTHYAARVDHLAMMEQSYVARHQNILIFEDDAIIQGDFDEAYRSACMELPADWRGLWLTSDGHQRKPVDFSPSLNRSTYQLFLHAYMLSRDGMHRIYSHVSFANNSIIDGEIQKLMSKEPHYYSTKKNAAIQIGQRSNGDAPRNEYFGRKPRNYIVPPYHGEFGCMLLRHVRYVHELEADTKIVCCRRGEELLYPSATGFEYGWREAGPDSSRVGNGSPGVAPGRNGYTAVNPRYNDDGTWNHFKPSARPMLPRVDVGLGARRRSNPVESAGKEPSRNWPHWSWLAERLREAGLTVGVIGERETSEPITAAANAWDHPDGHTAGSVDLLSHCRLYIGTDSGPTHLAALCGAPTLAFRLDSGPDMMIHAQAMNPKFTRLDGWNDRDAVLTTAMKRLRSSVTMLTGCDDAFRRVLEPTLPGKIAYCQRHDIRFANRPYTVMPWGDRQQLMLDELPRADWLWFLDADTIIMNHAIDIRSVIDRNFDCIIGIDRYGINNGSMLLRNCPATIRFLNDVMALRGQVANDQVAMKRVMDATPGYRVKYIGQRAFNSYIETEYGRSDDEQYAYRPGDLLLHLPGMPNQRRVELIAEYLPRVTARVKRGY